jgi:hypothetical protein
LDFAFNTTLLIVLPGMMVSPPSLGGISLDGLPPHTWPGTTKRFSLFKFKGLGFADICGGVITGGSRFCVKKAQIYSYTRPSSEGVGYPAYREGDVQHGSSHHEGILQALPPYG